MLATENANHFWELLGGLISGDQHIRDSVENTLIQEIENKPTQCLDYCILKIQGISK